MIQENNEMFIDVNNSILIQEKDVFKSFDSKVLENFFDYMDGLKSSKQKWERELYQNFVSSCYLVCSEDVKKVS